MGEATSDFLVHRLAPPVAVILAGVVLVAALVLLAAWAAIPGVPAARAFVPSSAAARAPGSR